MLSFENFLPIFWTSCTHMKRAITLSWYSLRPFYIQPSILSFLLVFCVWNIYIVFKKTDDEKCHPLSMDAKYILTGGEDDLVQVWSMEDRKVVAWGEGHNSWVRFSNHHGWLWITWFWSSYTVLIWWCWQVSGVAFDSYWSSPNSDGTGENVVYRFGSVGQVWYTFFLQFMVDLFHS